MAPLKPHWKQPSHPDVQEVIINEHEFTSKSLSKVSLAPFGLYAKMDFPPCTLAAEPTYATVQCGQDKHLNLNSDLLYINHSREPSLIFDTANLNIIAGPKGLQPGQELTFFYPSTEWAMAQSFNCLCCAPTCRGRISGARDMTEDQLKGTWQNGHIRKLLEEKQQRQQESRSHANTDAVPGNGTVGEKEEEEDYDDDTDPDDATAQALKDALRQAEKVVEAARIALHSYVARTTPNSEGSKRVAALDSKQSIGASLTRRGATSRALSGEMGGDTVAA
ncbi:hypothetical protein F4778DRAFT_455409 [Xylariomycetidae sp. FL2044]|nr:hypothetical protein F4778DRAFT_455409 [Xylariomycetidae sp. FL2044]